MIITDLIQLFSFLKIRNISNKRANLVVLHYGLKSLNLLNCCRIIIIRKCEFVNKYKVGE